MHTNKLNKVGTENWYDIMLNMFEMYIIVIVHNL